MTFQRYWSLLQQDLVLAWRNGFFAVIVVMAVLFAVVINFVVPREAILTAHEYVVDLTEGQVITPVLERAGRTDALLASEDELTQRLKDDRRAVGIVFSGTVDSPAAVIHRQGYEPEASLRGLKAAIDDMWAQAGAFERKTQEVQLLRPESARPPFNLTLVPLILFTEVVTLGFVLAAVMVFQEKAEGSVRAYRVSPGGSWPYILSKTTTNVVLSLVYGLLILIATVGFSTALPQVLVLVALAAFLVTVVGLLASTFYSTLSDFIYTVVVASVVFSLPVAAYFVPAFNLPVFRLIPSYQLMFGVRELLFSTGKQAFMGPMMAALAAEGMVALLLCKWVIEHRLMKEAV